MLPKSLRWRLPLSYAGIALIAALVLGFVLMTTLRNFYAVREQDYLQANARFIAAVTPLKAIQSMESEELQSRLSSFAFFARFRVQLLDAAQQIIADSGLPHDTSTLSIEFSRAIPADGQARPGDFIWSVGAAPDMAQTEQAAGVVTRYEPSHTWVQPLDSENVPVPDLEATSDQLMVISVAPTIFGWGLGDVPVTLDQRRSDQAVQHPIVDKEGQVTGYVRLSEGPAYGLEIVDGVAQAWLIASAVAVILAAGTGWLVSYRLSAPLLALTQVTSRMAQGDLSARASIRQQDEIGILARTFNDMAAKVEETVLVLRRFVADAAHEIHTPLTALRTNLELALGEDVKPDYRAFLERAQGQVKRLETLTDGLLQLSRIETAATDDLPEAVDLTVLVQEMSEFYASQAEQAGLTFQLELPETPLMACLHPAQFRSALCNLLDNAIKFTPENGTVKLVVCRKGQSIEVCVQDTGIGIPTEDVPLVFNRFHRGRNVSAYVGSGLGLAIVKAVMERQRGLVSVQSSAAGTQFVLRLPAVA
jgi:signal transduction histidine kinase